MNPLLSALSGGGNGVMSILMQAVGAAIRGESPEDFVRNLARTNPIFKGVDPNDLEGTANKLAKQKGTTVDEVVKSAKQKVGGLM